MQTFTGREYLMIDIANNFGSDEDGPLDKQTWRQRIACTFRKLNPSTPTNTPTYTDGVRAGINLAKKALENL